MRSYAFWNNKGGVGKSYLCFISACEYARLHPDDDVLVVDLCPQANVSETLLGGFGAGSSNMDLLYRKTPRASISGYIDSRLNSPFRHVSDEECEEFVARVSEFNTKAPNNVYLVCGDNLLEIQAEAIRQTSQLSIPRNAWAQVVSWVRDLTTSIDRRRPKRDTVVFLDCNPSFAVFTQLALVASEHVIVPFTADDSSRRGMLNIAALLHGIGDKSLDVYLSISFAQKAKESSVRIPTLHSFVSNRVTRYRGQPSSAFQAVIDTIKTAADDLHKTHRGIFSNPQNRPSSNFVFIPDYHSACIVSSSGGIPMHELKPGHHTVHEETIQLNPDPLSDYKTKLGELVDRL